MLRFASRCFALRADASLCELRWKQRNGLNMIENNELNSDAPISPHEIVNSQTRAMMERRLMNALGAVAERTSWDGCRRLGNYLGLIFFAVARRRRERAIANLQLALGFNGAKATRIARRGSQNWGMTICEFLHLPNASPDEIRAHVSLEGLENLQDALAAGNGAIILMAHLGNWEATAARLALETPMTGIVRPLYNAAAQRHMTAVRNGYGLRVISKHAAARPSLKTLRAGGSLIILPDRHAGREGALLPLFGHETRFETAPARFAMMSGSPIVPITGARRDPWYSDGRIQARVSRSFRVAPGTRDDREAATLEGTRQVIASIEDMIRAHPDQWSWMLRRWRDDRETKGKSGSDN